MTPSAPRVGEGMTALPPHLWEFAQRIPKLANGSYTIVPVTIYTVESNGTVKCIAQANGKTAAVRKNSLFTDIVKKLFI